jgi:hypothetical protein
MVAQFFYPHRRLIVAGVVAVAIIVVVITVNAFVDCYYHLCRHEK